MRVHIDSFVALYGPENRRRMPWIRGVDTSFAAAAVETALGKEVCPMRAQGKRKRG